MINKMNSVNFMFPSGNSENTNTQIVLSFKIYVITINKNWFVVFHIAFKISLRERILFLREGIYFLREGISEEFDSPFWGSE
jgi:hypothetical protein